MSFIDTLVSDNPILQNGKLVGAKFANQTCHGAQRSMVTHVLINDPTTGYGIFIENILGQMGDLADQLPVVSSSSKSPCEILL